MGTALAGHALLRLLLVLAVVAVAVAVVAAHGVRGIVALLVLGLVASVPRTRAWKWVERPLVRLTGSRARALALVMIVAMGLVVALNVYEWAR